MQEDKCDSGSTWQNLSTTYMMSSYKHKGLHDKVIGVEYGAIER